MRRDLRMKIYAVVALRPSTPLDVSKILHVSTDEIDAALTGMDSSGLLLYEDGDDLHTYGATPAIPLDIWGEASDLVDAFERQMPLPDAQQKTGV